MYNVSLPLPDREEEKEEKSEEYQQGKEFDSVEGAESEMAEILNT